MWRVPNSSAISQDMSCEEFISKANIKKTSVILEGRFLLTPVSILESDQLDLLHNTKNQ